MEQVIVVGGGLAGMSAAHTVLEHGSKVVLLDKMAFCGGNSTKATSGINGSGTRAQRMLNISDSPEIFEADTIKGGADRPDLVRVLTYESGPAIDWLMDKFKLDLSLVARLGGHSQPRTHRGKEKFPGMTITYAQIEALEDEAEKGDRARIIQKATVQKLLTDKSGAVIGCEYVTKDGKTGQEWGPVIFASGGYGADFAADSLIAKHRPDLMHLPTTNGEHCTGDAIKMGVAIGADTVDLNWIQVHPTGLVHPDEPDSKIKFLAAEALRGVGGVLLDGNGQRFSNELGRRDYVTGMMWKNKGPFRLCLNGLASTEIVWHCKHYKGRGLMKSFASGDELAKEIGCSSAVLSKTFAEYNEIAKKMTTEGGPEGPHEAYPSGKTWCPFGKKFFHNFPVEMNDGYHVAIVTPVIHYCMGGLRIGPDAGVQTAKGEAIKGLYCTGEAAGGIHGQNRLGGNSLLDCVVYGRVAARTACQHMMTINQGIIKANPTLKSKL